MKMQTLITGMVFAAAPALGHAEEALKVPAICATVANYAAQALDQEFTDGSFGDKHNPAKLELVANFKNYPMHVKYLGNCDEDYAKMKPSWCQVAGGSPSVYQAEVTKADANGSYDFATIVVTYNRGGCWVDEASRK